MTGTGLTRLRQTLKQAGSSSTKSRVVIFSSLQQGPLSMARLVDNVRNQTDRATVYRTVDLFEKLGIINRIWYGPEPLVELSEIFTPHHHHALCQNCGKVVDFAGSELEAALSAIAKTNQFLALSHSIELSGYCSDCQH